mmetsp:Transcript_7476/g.31101  ORF Transcript_7476/g.31101 Transcript_7476/m.31101 type:complete len:290 (-) Transcript_7476:645-1514(-)
MFAECASFSATSEVPAAFTFAFESSSASPSAETSSSSSFENAEPSTEATRLVSASSRLWYCVRSSSLSDAKTSTAFLVALSSLTKYPEAASSRTKRSASPASTASRVARVAKVFHSFLNVWSSASRSAATAASADINALRDASATAFLRSASAFFVASSVSFSSRTTRRARSATDSPALRSLCSRRSASASAFFVRIAKRLASRAAVAVAAATAARSALERSDGRSPNPTTALAACNAGNASAFRETSNARTNLCMLRWFASPEVFIAWYPRSSHLARRAWSRSFFAAG